MRRFPARQWPSSARQTALERTTVSNETGTYNFTNVLAGTYDVKVSLQGFKEFVETGVPVSVNTVSRVDVTLDRRRARPRR